MSIRYSPLRRCFCRNRFRRLCCQLMIQQNHLWKTLVALICLLLAVATLVVLFLYGSPNSSLYDDLDDLLSTDQQHLNSTLLHRKYLLYTPQCILRAIPLFDEQTRPFYSPPSNREYYCPPENPISAQIRRVNYTGVSVPQAGCQATEVERDPSNEGFRYGRKIYFGKRLLVDFPTADAVEVHCGGQTKVIPLIPSKKPIWRNEFSTSSPPSPSSQPNILAIGVDSISRLQFLRHFTSTQEFITKKRFEGPLYGLHKVGDNTFPNLIAMFTGLNRKAVEELIPSPSRKLDALPLVFKQFSARGYMTTFVEDMPTAGLWTFHGRNGFGEQQPLEYLIRPVSMVVWDQLENDFCYKGRLEMEFYYDFVYDQLLAFRERRQPHLTFIHMSTVVHEEPNNAAYADEPVRRFLEKIFAANLQQNTAILFYSDHGFRFGPISKTESGYHESRLPFMYWYIPEGLTLGDGLDAGQIRKNLRTNSRRLASQFDVHSTLLHILHGKPSPLPLSADKFFLDHTFGHSLFTELPLNRTCEEAGIPEEYCLCRRFVPLTDAHSRHLLGEFILEHLNEQLAPYSANCTPLSLGRILETKVSVSFTRKPGYFSFLFPSSFKSSLQTVSIRVLTEPPSNATFDVTLRVNVNELNGKGSLGAATIIEDRAFIQRMSSLIRLDRYSDQSACVRGTPVESFCYCKNLV